MIFNNYIEFGWKGMQTLETNCMFNIDVAEINYTKILK